MEEISKYRKCSRIESLAELEFIKELTNEYGHDVDGYNEKDINENMLIKIKNKVNTEYIGQKR